LKKKGDILIYEVYNLWKFNQFAKNLLKRFGLMTDITFLKSGTFSLKGKGEAFCTYGHIHQKNLGEVYQVLKNDCFLLLSHKKTFNTYLIKIKEGYSFFIHPSFIHRIVSGKKDCVVLNFVPEDAGHDYTIVKNKGFPFHVFYDKNKKLYFKENEKYPKVGLVVVENLRMVDALKIAEKKPGKLRKILRRPKDIYAITKNYL
jgi:oxalate decarboxylase/phosphoglucose isomerase-like protein (cupin superfamily)